MAPGVLTALGAQGRRPSALVMLLAGLTGAACAGLGFVVGRALPGIGSFAATIARLLEPLGAWDLLALPLLALLVIGIHELGHLAGGLSQGMRFLLLVIGPFQWHATPNGLRFQWVRSLGLMGGIAATLPRREGASLRRQMLPMVAGGPLASLLLLVVGVALAMTMQPGRVAAYAVLTAGLSAAIFLVTAVPLRAAGFMSDGMQFVELLRGGAGVAERMDLVRLAAQGLAGTRPRDWDADVLARLATVQPAEPVRRIAAQLLRLYHAMDRGDDAQQDTLAQSLESAVDLYPDGLRQSLCIELALQAARRRDAAGVASWLARSQGGIVEDSRRALAQAVACRLGGNEAGVRQHVQAGLAALDRAMDPGLARLTRDQLEGLDHPG